MKFRIVDIKVGDRKRELGDVTTLSKSIQEIGLLNPITIQTNGTLIAGYHRLTACTSLGWSEIEVNMVNLEALRAELAEIDENLIRSELHYIDRAEHLQRRKEIYEAMYPETKAGLAQAIGMNRAIGNNVGDTLSPTFTEDTASKIGVSERTVERSIQLAKTFTPEERKVIKSSAMPQTDATKLARLKPVERTVILERVFTGRAQSVEDASRQIKETLREQHRQENRETIAQAQTIDEALGLGKFSTIVIDPPWDWGDEGDVDQLGRAKPTYNTMSLSELLTFPVGSYADTDCHLYLWITNRSLPKGFQLLERWGFRYVTCVTWVKPYFGMGNYFRGQTEQLLFGVKGSLPLKRRDVGTVLHAPRGPKGHSSKPSESYGLIESCSPGPYLELFARSGRADWTSWGGEMVTEQEAS